MAMERGGGFNRLLLGGARVTLPPLASGHEAAVSRIRASRAKRSRSQHGGFGALRCAKIIGIEFAEADAAWAEFHGVDSEGDVVPAEHCEGFADLRLTERDLAIAMSFLGHRKRVRRGVGEPAPVPGDLPQPSLRSGLQARREGRSAFACNATGNLTIIRGGTLKLRLAVGTAGRTDTTQPAGVEGTNCSALAEAAK
jgi:hypothetical protein